MSTQLLIELIVRALVDAPDDVVVTVDRLETKSVIRVQVAATDVGKLIGKNGRTARSVRNLLEAMSAKEQHLYSLDIVEVR